MEEQGQVIQVVVFQLGDELYGADIAVVREVGPMQRVTRVPRTPRYIEGVTNLRGRVIPVIDLRRRLGLPVTAYTKQTRIAVAELEGGQVGMIVDSVKEVLRIPTDAIEPPTGLVSKLDAESITGVAKQADQLIVLLDLAQVLQREDRKVAG
ncbi:MAG TPA: chemotaxis protein CheW [Symbiobacteriaceae bacterium]|nr:chemotaxis protein CheW [Symbiobacteriaceae bacterium]